VFLGRNLETTNARRLIKVSEDVDFLLVFIFKEETKKLPLVFFSGVYKIIDVFFSDLSEIIQ